jgi:hypothetical protein
MPRITLHLLVISIMPRITLHLLVISSRMSMSMILRVALSPRLYGTVPLHSCQ